MPHAESFAFTPCRKQTSGIQASEVFLTNIRNNDVNGVYFDMYIQVQSSVSNRVLNQQALLKAVSVSLYTLTEPLARHGWSQLELIISTRDRLPITVM